MIPGEGQIYKSIETMLNKDESMNIPREISNSLNPPPMPSHILNGNGVHFYDLSTFDQKNIKNGILALNINK